MGANVEIKEKTAELFKLHRETNDESERIFLENEIIQINFNFAVHKTRPYLHTTLDEDDLLASATVGLFLAVRTYDYTRAQFSTYAGKVIENELNQLVRKETAKMRFAPLVPLSLDVTMKHTDTMADYIADDTQDTETDYVNKQLFQDLFAICASVLSEFELTVLKNYLLPNGERKTQQELGVLLSKAQTTIARTEKKAINKLRDYIAEQEWGLELLRG